MSISFGEFMKLANLAGIAVGKTSADLTNIVLDADGNITSYKEGPFTYAVTYNADGDIVSVVRQ